MQAINLFADTVQASTAFKAMSPVTYDGALAAADDLVYGVAFVDAEVGDQVAVAVIGTAQVMLSTAVAPGDGLIPDGVGGVKKIGKDDVPFARARKSGAAGARAEVFLLPQ